MRAGLVWPLPYDTGKSASLSRAETFAWYDELVISRNEIADPGP